MQMFKQGIKNYFYNIKHFFTPLGVFFLGILLACSFFAPTLISTLKSLIENINKVNNTELSYTVFQDDLFNTILSLDFSDSTSFSKLLDVEWLKETFIDCIKLNLPEINSETETLISNSINRIGSLLLGSLFFVLLGLIGGYFLTKYLIRKEIAKRALWKFFLVSLIDSILSATLVAFCLSLLAYWVPSIFFSSLLSLLLFGTISLFEAYLVHGYKKVKLRKILTIKNIGIILLVNLTIFVIASIFVSLITLVANGIIGFCIALPLLEIAFIVIGLNAESFVKNCAEKNIAL